MGDDDCGKTVCEFCGGGVWGVEVCCDLDVVACECHFAGFDGHV